MTAFTRILLLLSVPASLAFAQSVVPTTPPTATFDTQSTSERQQHKARPSPDGGFVNPKADNTAINRRDRKTGEVTADDQKNNKSDVEIAAAIRRSVMRDTLSVNAHNVKIIVQDGTVTLKGVVLNVGEKAIIEEKAAAVVGEARVKSELQAKH